MKRTVGFVLAGIVVFSIGFSLATEGQAQEKTIVAVQVWPNPNVPTNPSGANTLTPLSTKTGMPLKSLPKTGDKSSILFPLLGSLMINSSIFIFFNQRKGNTLK